MSQERVSFAPGVDLDAAVARAVGVLRSNGVVVLDAVVDPALIARCRAEVEETYPDLAKTDRVRNYGPYKGRHTMPMLIERTLADRAIFLPHVVERIAETLLGADFQVDSIGLLVAAPGAPEQVGHPDGTLFPEARIDRVVPVFALACSMPLVPMDEINGTTAFWRRSHRIGEISGGYDYAPQVLPGSVLLWDFRTWHCGRANLGDRPRPIVYSVFSREWWVEQHPPGATLYEKLQIARPVYDALKPRLQRRVSRALLMNGTETIVARRVGVRTDGRC